MDRNGAKEFWMMDTFIMSRGLWIASNEMGAIYNPRAIIILDGYMYKFTHEGERTIYNCSVMRHGALTLSGNYKQATYK